MARKTPCQLVMTAATAVEVESSVSRVQSNKAQWNSKLTFASSDELVDIVTELVDILCQPGALLLESSQTLELLPLGGHPRR